MFDWDKPRSTETQQFRACALLVPSVRLALVWRSSGVDIHTWKNAHILNMEKMCAEVDAHDEWKPFMRRSRRIINEFWHTPSESRRTDQNISFFCALDVRHGICDWALTSLALPDQRTRGVEPVLVWCWASVNVSCLLGALTSHIVFRTSARFQNGIINSA